MELMANRNKTTLNTIRTRRYPHVRPIPIAEIPMAIEARIEDMAMIRCVPFTPQREGKVGTPALA